MHDSAIQPQMLREAWEKRLQQCLTQVALNMLLEGIDLAGRTHHVNKTSLLRID
ncbi:hypothetical protein JYQ62_29840 [Nostoc sp. UHCC 0702]|nr:hypothetical protein JYQ62_29840 [Nostoc sp. UHCC 0702]